MDIKKQRTETFKRWEMNEDLQLSQLTPWQVCRPYGQEGEHRGIPGDCLN